MAQTSRARAHIGRTSADSTPAFEPLPRPPDGAPNVVLIVLDDLGFAQLGCFGSRHRDAGDRRRSPPAACASTASTSPRCARRRAPACSPAATITPSAWASSPTSRSACPGYNAPHPAQRRRRCRASCATPATAPSRSASGTSRRAGSRSASGPFDRWPLGLGFERYYGFLNGDTNQWTPELVRDNGFVEPPRTPGGGLPPDRGPRRPRDPHDPGPAAGDAGEAVLPLLRARARCTRRTRRPRAWIERYRGRFDDGWEAWRGARLRAPARARHRAARARRSPSARRGSRAGATLPADAAPALRPHDGGLRRLPRAHRRADRPRARLSSTTLGAARRHARAGALRQRRQRRGRADRLVQRASLHRTTGSTTSTTRWRASTSSAASAPTTTTPGAGRGPGNTPLPPVEALHLARRRAHAADRALAAAARRARARCARSSATPST